MNAYFLVMNSKKCICYQNIDAKKKLNLQIYGIHLLNPYKTVLSHLKGCVHLGQQMSSNFTVKWVWIFFACQQDSPFHGFANSS